ncbi:hypothetical protein CCFV1_ORF002 [Cotesia congregata filamentous virus 1]|uniref:Uncharacterized protein n=1 Tax=Cotesia congregata filamentous virus 1 TaxID=3064291 RepID=A0ABC8QN42_9VIRU|nr:hypothetical protein CCFV1_ORF002 [Cotesia congregata filamentous virus 1]
MDANLLFQGINYDPVLHAKLSSIAEFKKLPNLNLSLVIDIFALTLEQQHDIFDFVDAIIKNVFLYVEKILKINIAKFYKIDIDSSGPTLNAYAFNGFQVSLTPIITSGDCLWMTRAIHELLPIFKVYSNVKQKETRAVTPPQSPSPQPPPTAAPTASEPAVEAEDVGEEMEEAAAVEPSILLPPPDFFSQLNPPPLNSTGLSNILQTMYMDSENHENSNTVDLFNENLYSNLQSNVRGNISPMQPIAEPPELESPQYDERGGSPEMEESEDAAETEEPEDVAEMEEPEDAAETEERRGAPEMEQPAGAAEMEEPAGAAEMEERVGATEMEKPGEEGSPEMEERVGAAEMEERVGAAEMEKPGEEGSPEMEERAGKPEFDKKRKRNRKALSEDETDSDEEHRPLRKSRIESMSSSSSSSSSYEKKIFDSVSGVSTDDGDLTTSAILSALDDEIVGMDSDEPPELLVEFKTGEKIYTQRALAKLYTRGDIESFEIKKKNFELNLHLFSTNFINLKTLLSFRDRLHGDYLTSSFCWSCYLRLEQESVDVDKAKEAIVNQIKSFLKEQFPNFVQVLTSIGETKKQIHHSEFNNLFTFLQFVHRFNLYQYFSKNNLITIAIFMLVTPNVYWESLAK